MGPGYLSDGTTTLDLIPVRKDGVGYMYDKISGKLFGKEETGNFIIGPDKVPQPTYIQDGLIFHLDGINIGNNEGYWTDLVDGVKFNIPAGVTHEDDHFIFAKSHGMMQADTLIDWDAKTCHLEICLSGWTGANQMFIFDSRNDLGIALGSIKTNVLIFGHGQRQYGRNRDFKCTSMLSTISVNNTLAYQNASACELVSDTYWGGGGSGITIGSRGSAMIYTGTIYSVRCYNRHLTEDEICHNFAVDARRFNITT